MKIILTTVCAAFFCANSNSQTIVKPDFEPQVGENYYRHAVDNQDSLHPGNSGVNQTWDLSNLIYTSPPNDYFFQVKNPSSTPHTVNGASFVIENYPMFDTTYVGYNYFRDTVNGYYSQHDYGAIVENNYTSPVFVYKFPLSFGDSIMNYHSFITTSFTGTEYYSGVSKLKFDGMGTLMLPNSVIITNVFRIKIETANIRTSPQDTSYTTDYLWYKAGVHHVIAECNLYTDPNGVTYHFAKTYDLTNVSGIDDKNQNNTLTVFPNPANESVNINASGNIENILVADITGKVINESQNMTSKKFSMETKELVNGIYFLQIRSKQNNYARKLIIQH